jgi:hypothetical protein
MTYETTAATITFIHGAPADDVVLDPKKELEEVAGDAADEIEAYLGVECAYSN